MIDLELATTLISLACLLGVVGAWWAVCSMAFRKADAQAVEESFAELDAEIANLKRILNKQRGY